MEFRILGPLEVVHEGRELTPARPKQRALLAFLLLRANEVVSSDDLVTALWGETPPETAHTALHGHVSGLRKLLGSETIETRPPGYVLRLRPEQLDLARFEEQVDQARRENDPHVKAELLGAALSLFRGEPLADFRYDAFASDDARRIAERRVAALEERFEAELALGRPVDLIPELEQLVSANPLRERLRGQLMLALYRAGRQADALHVYQEGRRELAEQLGIDPGPSLQDLERKILTQNPALAPAAPPPASPGGRERPERRASAAPPFIRRHPVRAATLGLLLAVAAALAVTIALRHEGTADRIAGDAVGIIDLKRGRLVGSVPLGSRPGAVATGPAAVWVTLPDRGAIVQIDPETRAVVDTIPVGADPSGISVGSGSVWVTNSGNSTVSRISPATNSVVQTIDVPGGVAGITVGRDGVWVANTFNDSVSRIDPGTGKVTATIAVGDQPVGIAAADRGVWVANAASGTVTHASGGQHLASQTVDVGNGPHAIAAGSDAVWVANLLDGTASRIDPETDAVVRTIPVGEIPTGIAVGGGFVWVSDESQGSVTRIDPRNGDETIIPLGSQAGSIAIGDGSLWVSVRGPETDHRGGELTVLSSSVLDTIDPALAYFSDSWNILDLTNDGLVGFRHVGGLDGASLVPNLARSIPRPTDGGRSYTFHLRSGLRYSNGTTVRPGDFRRALERVFRLQSNGAFYYTVIEGARACTRTPETCDLSQGIVADRAANTVTFHLVMRDPDFVYRLALPFTFAVPSGTPDRAVDASPIPATGPYTIARYAKDQELVLSRNPVFREWSKAAQPDGFPDRIVWHLGVDDTDQVSRILNGRADLSFRELPPNLLSGLASSHAGQVRLAPRNGAYFMGLNTTTRPFDDVRVRRALNFAVDRRLIGRIFRGIGSSTCQVLPPNFPGYVPYCPFTRHPNGTWTAPDLASANELVAASGTAGSRVTVWATPDYAFGIPVSVGRYFVRVLDRLGYRATLKVVETRKQYFADTLDPAGHVQIAFSGWVSDYPVESGFIVPVLSCATKETSGSQFCDPQLDRRMAQAARLQVTDLAAAHRRWTAIEHDLTDAAPWVPLVNRSWVNFVSKRLGNFQVSPQWGPLLDQMWVH